MHGNAMIVKLSKARSIWFGLVMGVVIFGFSFWGIDFALGPGDKTLRLLLYIPACLFLFIYVVLWLSLLNLGYRADEKSLTIIWGIRKIVIPWEAMENVVQVKGRSNLYSLLGVSWPGYMIGLYNAKGLGPVRMYGTNPWEGFLYIKSKLGFFGLTPSAEQMQPLLDYIAAHGQKEIESVDMDAMPREIRGQNMLEDGFYRTLFILNIVFLAGFAIYLAICFPGSGAPNFTILLLVLAIALFFFDISNAGRLYQFSDTGGYVLLLISVAVTGLFWILALSEITL